MRLDFVIGAERVFAFVGLDPVSLQWEAKVCVFDADKLFIPLSTPTWRALVTTEERAETALRAALALMAHERARDWEAKAREVAP